MTEKGWLKLMNLSDSEYYKEAFTLNVDDSYALMINSSSKGNQRKWYYPQGDMYVKDQFIYRDEAWKDYLVEIIASEIIRQCDVHYRYADYYKAFIIDTNGKESVGCVSKNFLTEDEELVTVYRCMKREDDFWQNYPDLLSKWKCLSENFEKLCGKNCDEYMSFMFLVDYLICNEDRHLNNIALVHNVVTDAYVPAPLFDFGLGLLQASDCYETPLVRVKKRLMMKPFGRDVNRIIDFILEQYDSRYLLPECLNLSDCVFPSYKSWLLLKSNAEHLGVKVIGGELHD